MTEERSQRRSPRGTALRLFLTVWLLYAIHATTNVVRETYLAIALGTHGSIRVDEYVGLHPDLFEMPGRGAYINNNPGASILGGVAYLAVRPVLALAIRMRPDIAQPKPPATYDDPRPNRTRFMNAARARGLDITLGLGAIGIQVLLMAPLGALAAVLMFGALQRQLGAGSEREALWWALAYAFATPLLFRSAFLNHNAIMAHATLGAFLLVRDEGRMPTGGEGRPPSAGAMPRGWLGAGLLLGFALLCDYSAVPLLLVFGLWALADGWKAGGVAGALRVALVYTAGALPVIVLLLGYQWYAFGSPWYPAQHYMPPTEYSVLGWNGFTVPSAGLLWGNLFDLRYGLFAFCPLLFAALAAPLARGRPGALTARQLTWALTAFVALYLFSSANQFANLQWNTGVRYLVPVVPLLFLAAVPVLRVLPLLLSGALVLGSLLISLAVSMMREDVPVSLRLLFTDGPTLPVLLVLRKMASGYASLQLPNGIIWAVYAGLALVLWLVWRGPRRATAAAHG